MKKINALAILGLVVLGACGPRNLAPAPMAMPMDPATAAAPVVDDNAAIAGRVLQQISSCSKGQGEIGSLAGKVSSRALSTLFSSG